MRVIRWRWKDTTLAIRTLTGGYTWGDNKYGQLGNGYDDPCAVPVRVIRADGKGYLENIVSISAGYWHSIAIDVNGVIWTWGKTADGGLGLANIVNAPSSICDTAHRIPVVYNETQETFAFGTELAIEDANDDDLLVGTWGIYYENVDFDDKSITLESEDPNDWDVVAATIIDGQYSTAATIGVEKCGVYFDSGSGSRLAGFTVTGGVEGGIICADLSSAYISKCIIRDNPKDGIFLDDSSVDITHCIILENGSDSDLDYGGIYCTDITSEAVNITNNWICGNGEGADGSGINVYSSDVALDDLVIRHNTIADNAGYGIKTSGDLHIDNCIIWDNNSGSLDQNDHTVTYSCIENGYTGPGTGNISSDPGFVDDVNDDYHITFASDCNDAGDPNFVGGANETDIDGNPRVMGGRVDIGADEDYPHCREADYDDWVLLGRPDCWMTLYQCEGDAAVDVHRKGYRVYTMDLGIVIASWKKKAGEAGLNPCGDLDHEEHRRGYRVYTGDMGILVTYWKQTDPNMPGECLQCLGGGEAMAGGGEAMSIAEEESNAKDLLDWLAEVWLDADVRRSIDAEAWLKMYESMKELE